jgi:hypothetical protein
VDSLFLRRKRRLKVDLGDLKDERESLSSFLRSKLNVEVTSTDNKVTVDSPDLPPEELKRMVTKFVYRRNLMNEYWTALESDTVKIKKLKRTEKERKQKKEGTQPSTIKHGW